MSSYNYNKNYFFVHNVFAHFFDDTLNYFADYLYPRFKHQVVGTYDKAVEYINKKMEYGNEHDMPNLPAIILNPSGEFKVSDAISGATHLWRFPNLSKGHENLKLWLYDPIYQDNNIKIHPVFGRIKGDFELILLLNSFYEYCDMKLYLYQIFGGENRPIYPSVFRTFLIIPDEILNYEYVNPITNTRYHIDWDSAGAFETLVKTTNKNEIVVPVNIKPRYTLINMADASIKYGGTDKLADWRLNVNVEYEIEIPWYVYLKSDYLLENVNFNFCVLSYMGNIDNILKDSSTYEEFLNNFNWDLFSKKSSSYNWGLSDGVNGKPLDENIVKQNISCDEYTDWKKGDFYYYIITDDDVNNLNNDNPINGFEIPLKYSDDTNIIHIISKYGQLIPLIDYTIEDINVKDSLIKLIPSDKEWKKDDILEIYTFIKE